MPVRKRWIEALALACALPAWADTPLAPPAAFQHQTAIATVRGDVDQDRTFITQHGASDGPTWSIPVWARWYSLSPSADSILVLNPGGNLLNSRDPDQLVMTVWYLKGDAPHAEAFTLAAVMDPADMPQTASHYSWLNHYAQGETGWRLQLSDERRITVTYR